MDDTWGDTDDWNDKQYDKADKPSAVESRRGSRGRGGFHSHINNNDCNSNYDDQKFSSRNEHNQQRSGGYNNFNENSRVANPGRFRTGGGVGRSQFSRGSNQSRENANRFKRYQNGEEELYDNDYDKSRTSNRYSRGGRREGHERNNNNYDNENNFVHQRSGRGNFENRRGGRGTLYGNSRDNENVHYNDHKSYGTNDTCYEESDDKLNTQFSEQCSINDRPTYRTKVFQNSNQDDVDDELNPEQQRTPVTYVPPEFDESEQSVFSRGIRTGVNFDKYDTVKVKVTGGSQSFKPLDSFNELDITPILLDNIKRCDYSRPTPIQRYALPLLLNNNDIMACAQTGSGKTAAFVLPILNHILKNDLHSEVDSDSRMICCHPIALVIVPTRELVLQTFAECKKFSFGTRVRTVQIYGGVSVQYQLSQLRLGCEIVVGTTGRLLDVIRRGALLLDRCSILILDEADRMLDMGFEPDVREIIKAGQITPIGDRRCTGMFSATFPPEVQQLAQNFLRTNYSFITVGVVGGACEDVEQKILSVNKSDKRNKLKEILGTLGERKTLIFVEQKRFADFLASDLNQSGFKTTSIHGDRMQKEREEALRDFVRGKMPYLVATSVAARGLDIPGVENVINYDLPDSITEYVHRIGRTGRCGNTGKSISFYDDTDERCTRLATSLVAVLKDAHQDVPDFLSDNFSVGAYASNEFDGIRHEQRDMRKNPKFNQQSESTQPTFVDQVDYNDEDCWD